MIDLISLNPIDYETILSSVRKTRRLLVVDVQYSCVWGWRGINSVVAEHCWSELECVPRFIACPAAPCRTATSLTETYHPIDADIANAVLAMMGKPQRQEFHLPPQFDYDELLNSCEASDKMHAQAR